MLAAVVGKLMSFIEDEDLILWKQYAGPRRIEVVLHAHICKEKCMIDHHDLGSDGSLPRHKGKAGAVIFAFFAATGVTITAKRRNKIMRKAGIDLSIFAPGIILIGHALLLHHKLYKLTYKRNVTPVLWIGIFYGKSGLILKIRNELGKFSLAQIV